MSATTTTTTTAPATTQLSANALLDLIKNRRSHYPQTKDIPISNARVQEIVTEALLHVPSSFNSQSNRAVVLFGAEHDKLWDIVSDTLRAIVPEERWQPSAERIARFKGGAGTVMFFEDQAVVDQMQAKFPTYADKFPVWATQSDAMLQFVIWTALEAEGLAANLQHYNPIIDEKVAEAWKVPATWKLNAQMVFGGKTGEAGPKAFAPVDKRLMVFGA